VPQVRAGEHGNLFFDRHLLKKFVAVRHGFSKRMK
jgi:hypothetical protein